ncbi:hypothetical protein D3C72_2058850 [compost metagenome]
MALTQRNTAKGAAVLVRCRQRTGEDRVLVSLECTVAEHGLITMGIQGQCLADLRTLPRRIGDSQIFDNQPAAVQKQGRCGKRPLLCPGLIRLPGVTVIRNDNFADPGNGQIRTVDPHRLFIHS